MPVGVGPRSTRLRSKMCRLGETASTAQPQGAPLGEGTPGRGRHGIEAPPLGQPGPGGRVGVGWARPRGGVARRSPARSALDGLRVRDGEGVATSTPPSTVQGNRKACSSSAQQTPPGGETGSGHRNPISRDAPRWSLLDRRLARDGLKGVALIRRLGLMTPRSHPSTAVYLGYENESSRHVTDHGPADRSRARRSSATPSA